MIKCNYNSSRMGFPIMNSTKFDTVLNDHRKKIIIIKINKKNNNIKIK
jgi:hypothetical protein